MRGAGWCVVSVCVGVAQADPLPPPAPPEPPPATPPPAQVEPTPVQPSATAPAPAPIVVTNERTVDRQGWIFLGGVFGAYSSALNQSNNAEPVILIAHPVPVAEARQLRVGAYFSYDAAAAIIPGVVDLEIYALTVMPVVSYDWKMPIQSTLGDFVIGPEGGVAVTEAWLKIPDQPYMPGRFDEVTLVALDAALDIQFRAHGGLVFGIQPLSIGIPLNHPSAPPPYTITTQTSFGFALLAGFQFQ